MEKGVEIEIKEYALLQLKEEYIYYFTEYSETLQKSFMIRSFKL